MNDNDKLIKTQEKVIDLWNKGYSAKLISYKLDLYPPVIVFLLKCAGIEPKQGSRSEIRKKLNANEIRHLYYSEHKTMKEIGKIYQVSERTIANFMDKNNMPRRFRNK